MVERRQPTTVMEFLFANKHKIEGAVPKQVDGERLCNTYLGAIRRNPDLQRCDSESLLDALIRLGKTGLELDFHNQAFLIPRRVKGQMIANLQWGYNGLLTLAKRTGTIASIHCDDVHANDFFEYDTGVLTHKPDLFSKDRGELLGSYCVIRFVNGGVQSFVMTLEDLDEVRDNSDAYQYAERKGYKNSVWHNHPKPMRWKTCLHRILKYTELRAEDAGLMAALSEDHDDVRVVSSVEVQRKSGNEAAMDLLAAAVEERDAGEHGPGNASVDAGSSGGAGADSRDEPPVDAPKAAPKKRKTTKKKTVNRPIRDPEPEGELFDGPDPTEFDPFQEVGPSGDR